MISFVFTLFAGNDQASAVLDAIALAAIFGAVLTYNRNKASLSAAESAGKAWREERDAALSHAARLTTELTAFADEKVALIAKVSALESRPDLTRLEGLMEAVTIATRAHEVSAAARTERLILAVERIATLQYDAAEELRRHPANTGAAPLQAHLHAHVAAQETAPPAPNPPRS